MIKLIGMNKKLYLIYVTGVGDSNPNGQRKAVKTWRLWGVEAELFQMNWATNEPWETKFKKLLARIDLLTTQNKKVAIVGASAGAAAVINAYSARKDQLVGCVLIAGKVNKPEAIGRSYSKRNPALVEAVSQCQESLDNLDSSDRKRILSRYALIDEIVPKSDSYIKGANNQVVFSAGHFLTIFTQMLLGAPSFIKFLKKLDDRPKTI